MALFIFTLTLCLLAFTLMNAIFSRRALSVIFYSVYFMPFVPITSIYWSNSINFWSIGSRYLLVASDPIAISIIEIMFTSVLAFFIVEIASNKKKSLRAINKEFNKFEIAKLDIVYTIVSSLFLALYIINETYYPMMLCIVSLILLSFSISCGTKFKVIHLAALPMSIIFSYIQATNGDREFVPLLFAIVFVFRGPLAVYGINRKWAFVGVSILIIVGILISINRNGEEIRLDLFAEHLVYGSWTAAILPLIDLLRVSNVEMLYGVTFWDAIQSSVFKMIYFLFDTKTPYLDNNPAIWFYTQGMGGIHISAISYKNGGIIVVFIVTFALALFTKIIDIRRHRSEIISYFAAFYIIYVWYFCWYSILPLFNIFTHAIIAFFISKIIFLVLPKKSMKYDTL